MQFFEKLLSLNLKDYGGADLPIGLILLCAFLGMIAATIVIQYTNALIYRTVKALIRHKALDAESAKDLKALGLADHKRILFALWRENSMLMRFLARVPRESPLTEPKNAATEAEAPVTDASVPKKEEAATKQISGAERRKEKKEALLSARYYLSPAYADHAKEILSGSEDTFWHTVGYCALFALLFIGLAWLLPLILPIIL